MYSYSILAAVAATFISTASALACEQISGFTPVWQENFDGNSVDTATWQYISGAGPNGEVEDYQDYTATGSGPACQVSNGFFQITPQNNGGQWTSCRIETRNGWTAAPGKITIVQSRLKLGQAGVPLQGIWPAFWSLGMAMRNGVSWPTCGEIDTFENIDGGALGHGTLHCGTECNDDTGLTSAITFDYGSFHTWAHAIDLTESDWTAQSITWYMDGQEYQVLHGRDVGSEAAWAATAQADMFFVINVAIGGPNSWPGPVAANTATGAAAGMEVQYVAVYQN
jgi:beta-glucanase (GH16 family)